MKLGILFVVVVLLSLKSSCLFGQSQIFLRIDGIDGGIEEGRYEDWIQVQSFSYEFSAGDTPVSPLRTRVSVDQAFPVVLQTAFSQNTFQPDKTRRVELVLTDSDSREFETWKLEDVLITEVSRLDPRTAVYGFWPEELEICYFANCERIFDSDPLGPFNGVLDPQLGFDGDYDGNSELDIADIERLSAEIRSTERDLVFDLSFDGNVDLDDLYLWVRDVKQTYIGDTNLDGEFNSSDLINVFQAGQYEDSIEGNSTWSTGDWNADGDFSTTDLIVAFQDGGYEQGPRLVATLVPETTSSLLLMAFWMGVATAFGNRHRCV